MINRRVSYFYYYQPTRVFIHINYMHMKLHIITHSFFSDAFPEDFFPEALVADFVADFLTDSVFAGVLAASVLVGVLVTDLAAEVFPTLALVGVTDLF